MKFDIDEEVLFYVDGGWTCGGIVEYIEETNNIFYIIECYGEFYKIEECNIKTCLEYEQDKK